MPIRDDPIICGFTEVGAYIKASSTTVWRLSKDDPTFPKPLRWRRRVGWRKSEIDAWMASKQAA